MTKQTTNKSEKGKLCRTGEGTIIKPKDCFFQQNASSKVHVFFKKQTLPVVFLCNKWHITQMANETSITDFLVALKLNNWCLISETLAHRQAVPWLCNRLKVFACSMDSELLNIYIGKNISRTRKNKIIEKLWIINQNCWLGFQARVLHYSVDPEVHQMKPQWTIYSSGNESLL